MTCYLLVDDRFSWTVSRSILAWKGDQPLLSKGLVVVVVVVVGREFVPPGSR